jgi:hypothetical protein
MKRTEKNIYKKPTTVLMAMGARKCTEKEPCGGGRSREEEKTSSLHDKNSSHTK